MLTSRQIFRYAVPARTVTKKHWPREIVCAKFILKQFQVYIRRSISAHILSSQKKIGEYNFLRTVTTIQLDGRLITR